MADESSEKDLSREWRSMIRGMLENMDSRLETELKTLQGDIKDLQTEIRQTMATSKEVEDVKKWVSNVESHSMSVEKKQTELKEEILKEIKDTYTTKDQFEPIKKIVWLVVTFFSAGIIGGLVTLLLKS